MRILAITSKNSGVGYHRIMMPLVNMPKDYCMITDTLSEEVFEGNYDLVIMNDFLEHVTNPHLILKTVYNLTHTDSIFFISNPNWRMGHPFIYRGAFDFDNFIFMLHFHCFDLEGFYGSLLKTPFFPKLDSEKMLPDENLTDWNHYFVFKHRD